MARSRELFAAQFISQVDSAQSLGPKLILLEQHHHRRFYHFLQGSHH
jgi:hypothetical protein